ncbi:MAG TPA: hypothetical protein VG013_29845 [Gemmataceae bacterium]|nr:hypothetical protein [Gemmataceae bacterium]
MRLLLFAAAVALAVVQAAPAPRAGQPAARQAKSHALIVVGLPGDTEHDKLFESTARQWRRWLTRDLGFSQADVRVLFGRKGKSGLASGPATRAAIERHVANLKQAMHRDDRLWVFFLGHGDYDGEHASFQLPGPDLRDDHLAKLFAGVRCREQVFWMTTSASGWFLRGLSARGRIVITATAADEEYNETEFPHALAEVSRLSPDRLDANKDGKVSVLELYRYTVAEVGRRFAADRRIPTEHAQLDDNGDGVGTEQPVADGGAGQKSTADGRLAARTFLAWKARTSR